MSWFRLCSHGYDVGVVAAVAMAGREGRGYGREEGRGRREEGEEREEREERIFSEIIPLMINKDYLHKYDDTHAKVGGLALLHKKTS